MGYHEAWRSSGAGRRAGGRGDSGYAVLLEHPPVITLGRSGTTDHLLAARRSSRAWGWSSSRPTVAETSRSTARPDRGLRDRRPRFARPRSPPLSARPGIRADLRAERVRDPGRPRRRADWCVGRRRQGGGDRDPGFPLGDPSRIRAQRRYRPVVLRPESLRDLRPAGDVDGRAPRRPSTARRSRPRSAAHSSGVRMTTTIARPRKPSGSRSARAAARDTRASSTRSRAGTPHRLPGGPLPEHRRVLGSRDRHVHDPRDICTRGCRYCAVDKGLRPSSTSTSRRSWPTRSSRWAVLRRITSVDRDDLSDGARRSSPPRSARSVSGRRTRRSRCWFPTQGNADALRTVLDASPDVLNPKWRRSPGSIVGPAAGASTRSRWSPHTRARVGARVVTRPG